MLARILALSAAQALPIAGLLLVAGASKAWRPVSVLSLERTVFSLVARSRLSLLALWRGLGWLELWTGALVLLLPGRRWPLLLAGAQLTAAACYLMWSLKKAPQKSCGCMGARGQGAVTARTIARTAGLAVLALLAAAVAVPWTRVLAEWPLVLGVLVEAALLLWVFVRPQPGLAASAGVPQDCATAPGPSIEDTLHKLRGSALWRQLRGRLTSHDYREEWREGCYRYFCYEAEYEQTPVTAVFAVRLQFDAPEYRVALVHEQSSQVLLQLRDPTTAGAPQYQGGSETV